MISDAELIYDSLVTRENIDDHKIVLIAHSLGTGIAIELAAHREVAGLVLSCAYDKYVAGVMQDKLPLIPLKWIIQEEYNSMDLAPRIHTPSLFLLAQEDKTVLHKRTERLKSHWGRKDLESYMVRYVNHETITVNQDTWSRINQFLCKLINNSAEK